MPSLRQQGLSQSVKGKTLGTAFMQLAETFNGPVVTADVSGMV